MVIVSWNMAKSSSVPLERVLKKCEEWEASVLLIQEPTGSLLHFGSRRGKTLKPRGCEFEWHGWLQNGGSQGSIVIVWRDGVSISNVAPVDLGVGQGTRRITATNPLVTFEAMEGAERMKIATCHAPFDISARAQYSRNALNAGKKHGADCIIGDMNTYGTSVPSGTRSRGSGYQAPVLGATSNRGRGSPLDKVFVADKLSDAYLAGRVIPGGDSQGVKRTRETSDRVIDITDFEWEACPSDHLPIFVAFHDQTCRVEALLKSKDRDDDEDDDMHPPKRQRTDNSGSSRPIRAR